MTWKQIERLFIKVTGATQDAHDEKWDHLNYAHRELCAHLELPELHVPDAEVTTVHQQDYIDVDDDVYNVDWIVDQSTGRKLNPEPGGMRGRARFIESGETRPPLGSHAFWVRKGSRIWLRDTPQQGAAGAGSEPKLLISFRFHPPVVGKDNWSEHPITPNQYDMALLKWAAANFFELHPPKNQEGAIDYQRGDKMMKSVATDLEAPKSPMAEENLDRREFYRQPGYSFNIQGR